MSDLKQSRGRRTVFAVNPENEAKALLALAERQAIAEPVGQLARELVEGLNSMVVDQSPRTPHRHEGGTLTLRKRE